MDDAWTLYTQTYQTVNKYIRDNMSRLNPHTNPYLNKNISFTDGTICYVTNKGIVKPYEEPPLKESNGCPGINNIIELDIPWTVQYTPGTILPTTPPLIVGTPMTKNTSCNHAGQNIYVTELLDSAESKFIGCYTNNNSELEGIQLNSEQCKQYAVDGNYSYFGVQDGYCFVSNDAPNTNSMSNIIYVTKNIWSTDNTTTSDSTAAFINDTGNLVINNLSKTNILWTSPNPPVEKCINGGDITITDATYGGNCNTDAKYTVQNGNATDKLKQVMDDNSAVSKYIFPINSSTFGDPAPGCNKSFNVNYMCGNTPFNQYIDEAEGKSGILSCTENVQQCDFYLIVLDDGRIYLSQGNPKYHPDNTVLWSPQNTEHVGDPNPKWKSIESKTGKNFMRIGETLAAGEWIGSPNGIVRLLMQTDGTLVIQTSVAQSGCPNNTGVSTAGTIGWNKIECTPNEECKADSANLGKLGYVDENLVRHDYPEKLVSTGTGYQQWAHFNSEENNLGDAVTGKSQQLCEDTCSKTAKCKGYVWDSETQTCYPKSSIYPRTPRTPRRNFTIVAKNKVPGGACTSTPISVDSATFASYKNGAQMTSTSPCSASIIVDSSEMSQMVGASEQLSNSNIATLNNIDNVLTQKVRQNNRWDTNQSNLLGTLKKEGMRTATMGDIRGINHYSQLYVSSNQYIFDALALVALGVTFITANELMKGK